MNYYWGLLPNSQKGMRVGRDIWHLMIPFDPHEGSGWHVGLSCYKEKGKYYSACMAGIPSSKQFAMQDLKPKSKDSCPNCVRIYNKLYKGK